MEFYSAYRRPKTIPQPETSPFEDEYEEVIDKNGQTILKKTGKVNVYEKIQEAGVGITLRELIQKYEIKIDDYDLTKIDEAVNDLTEMPDNLIDAMNVIGHAKDVFETAPQELRAQFNNNFNEFLIGSQNGTLKSLVKKYVENEPLQTQEEKIEENVQAQQMQTVQEQNGGIRL